MNSNSQNNEKKEPIQNSTQRENTQSSPTHSFKKPFSMQLPSTSHIILSHIYQLIQSEMKGPKLFLEKDFPKPEPSTSFKCKCKKTKCLKMYCQCFAVGKFCSDCACSDCRNSLQYEDERAAAIDEALERDPDAFNIGGKQKKGGCICKKTNCLKKYCQCFNAGIPCGPECKCINCCNKIQMSDS